MSGIQWQWLPGNWEMKETRAARIFRMSVAFSTAIGG
jgi:hypothetical protein